MAVSRCIHRHSPCGYTSKWLYLAVFTGILPVDTPVNGCISLYSQAFSLWIHRKSTRLNSIHTCSPYAYFCISQYLPEFTLILPLDTSVSASLSLHSQS